MLGLFKISPVFLLAGLMISGLDVLVAAPIATCYAIMVAMLTQKYKFNELLEFAFNNVREIVIVFFILMFAYGLAESFMATGVGAAIINIALNLGITAKTVALVGFLVTCVLSIATGTSWGTFAACAPVFLWLNHIVGGDLILTVCSIAGGACFGDNIGLISDTTVLSSGLQKVEVIHRIRHQGVWSGICLIITAIVIFLVGSSMGLPDTVGSATEAINSIPKEAWDALNEARPSAVTLLDQVKTGVPIFMVIPLIIVIGMAIKGIQTMICLGAGIISSLILGFVAGTVTSIVSFLDLIYTGFSGAGSWSIVMMMWVASFGGIMNSMHAFEPLSKTIVKGVKSVKQLMFCNSLLCLIGNAAFGDETAEIVTISPIIKTITDENVEASEEDMYTLRLRNATFADAFGVYGSQLIPWHCFVLFYVSIAKAVYPLHNFVPIDIIQYNFMAFIAVGSMLLLTITGWDRFIPLFKLPSEPDVKLKKDIVAKEI
ncbi:Na+/H+ antiporter NhaC family protein [Inediibacterium massiliense]|uniref:Na+/H+ antiporter NhaC family protein n=1 Tax=Inediibacterium massiliense TaxID=1658111 RepID=UPI0006B4B36F|nr:Na+/H+ antiporter NhaC family protein [Inediibacterium massiliense]